MVANFGVGLIVKKSGGDTKAGLTRIPLKCVVIIRRFETIDNSALILQMTLPLTFVTRFPSRRGTPEKRVEQFIIYLDPPCRPRVISNCVSKSLIVGIDMSKRILGSKSTNDVLIH